MIGRNTPPIGTVRPMVAHPAVLARIDAALRRVRSGRVSGCSHLERQPVATLCVAHPATVRCFTCAAAHVAGHSRQDELACDVCGIIPPADDPWDVLFSAFEVDAIVPCGRGRNAAIGIVRLYGWAICPSCREQVSQ